MIFNKENLVFKGFTFTRLNWYFVQKTLQVYVELFWHALEYHDSLSLSLSLSLSHTSIRETDHVVI